VTFDAIDAWWWPYLFILVAGWLATDLWRFLGVYVGDRIAEDSELLVLVRCVATALVAAVIGNLVIFPGGALAATPVWIRVFSVAAGFCAFMLAGKRVIAGVAVAEALLAGWFLLAG
jgi:hypothetical protein